ncbi:MAG TPA: lysophospholipid acyltransferase family protein [Thermoanaerobaculia bacterium]|nr:lysophospholipid acyltransferase family protein [Thermoanaerobaculia bacterium]
MAEVEASEQSGGVEPRPPRPWREPWRWLFTPWMLAVLYPMVAVTTAFWGTVAIALATWSQRVAFYCGTIWAWWLVRVSFVRIRVTGRERMVPGQSYVILMNHQGDYDILALYGFLGREFRWVMKEELRRVPFLGWACAAIGHIFVDRRSSARAIASLEEAKPRLTGGVSVVFFPEGTRSPDGRLLPFKKGGFVMARQLALPILPVTISGSMRVLPKGSHIPRPGRIRVLIHPPLDPASWPSDEELIATVRETIASGLDDSERQGRVGRD